MKRGLARSLQLRIMMNGGDFVGGFATIRPTLDVTNSCLRSLRRFEDGSLSIDKVRQKLFLGLLNDS